MRKNKYFSIIAVSILSVSLIISGCGKSNNKEKTNETESSDITVENNQDAEVVTVEEFDVTPEYTAEELDGDYSDEDYTTIICNDKDIEADNAGVIVSKNTVQITKSGTYVITGELSGNVIVDSNEEGIVKLVLNDAKITSENTSAIYVKNAGEAIITLAKGTTNVLADSGEYVYESEEESEPCGTIYSKEDLVINGEGTLNVTGTFNHAVQSKDNLKIISGNIVIDSVGDGIVGKDSVVVKEGQIDIKAGGDGIKATKAETKKGYVYIDNAIITINSENDGIQAETCLFVNDGECDITCTDDGFHSNNDMKIYGGDIKISAGDDGMHADRNLVIDNGNINILESYEGIEANLINVNNGNVNIVSDDDGFNAAGGNDESGLENEIGVMNREGSSEGDMRKKMSMHMGGGFESSTGELVINGGKIYVDASGDGLDSNGTITINGGEIYVDGPTNNGNGAMDYDSSCEMNGGILVAAGSTGMATAPTEGSSQYSVNAGLSKSYDGGTTITITDSSENVILEYTPSKTFGSFVFSVAELKEGESYTISANGEEDSSFTVTSITTNVGNGGMGMMGHGGMRR